MTALKVLVVDDSSVIRKILTDVIAADQDLDVVGTAANGMTALSKIQLLEPDVVTLDIEMPEMDGLETLKAIRSMDRDLPVIMFSTLSTRGAEVTLDALSAGATDYVTKPANVGRARDAFEQVANELLPRLKLFGAVRRSQTGPPRPGPVVMRPQTEDRVRAVMVGSSTGGPVALETMLRSVDPPLPVPILIVQHMPANFTASLAQRLNRYTASHVVEGDHGAPLEPGIVYIAPGGRHMTVRSEGGIERLAVHDQAPVNWCRPSVDVLLESSAAVYGADQLCIILTGMGHDGRDGAQLIVDAGGDVFAQDAATSVVWGMPGAVAELGLACEVLPIEEMGEAIVRRLAAASNTSGAVPA